MGATAVSSGPLTSLSFELAFSFSSTFFQTWALLPRGCLLNMLEPNSKGVACPLLCLPSPGDAKIYSLLALLFFS